MLVYNLKHVYTYRTQDIYHRQVLVCVFTEGQDTRITLKLT